MKLLIGALLLFTQSIYSQDLFLENRRSKNDSIVSLYQEKSKHKYLNLLPNVSYNPLENSFNIGISFSGLSNYYQQKQRNKIQLAQLSFNLEHKLQADYDKLILEVDQFNIDFQAYKNKIELLEIDKDLFQISQGKHNNGELPTEEFLIFKKNYLVKKKLLKLIT
tara:strand:+ start:328 stop:822 length:495 start_codon:yes stop_codon:yes gene_type:complete